MAHAMSVRPSAQRTKNLNLQTSQMKPVDRTQPHICKANRDKKKLFHPQSSRPIYDINPKTTFLDVLQTPSFSGHFVCYCRIRVVTCPVFVASCQQNLVGVFKFTNLAAVRFDCPIDATGAGGWAGRLCLCNNQASHQLSHEHFKINIFIYLNAFFNLASNCFMVTSYCGCID